MRIAVLNWTRRLVGGAEVTLAAGLAGMVNEGHKLALWYEMDRPLDRERLPLVEGQASWCVEEMGADNALAALRAWQPDLLFVHGLNNPRLERAALLTAPGVFFAHAYQGLCVSGTKTFTFPEIEACPHRFGVTCLLRYYPRRVGGLNPVTMVREYRRQAQRHASLQAYRSVLVLSEHMRSEYLRNGFSPERVVRLPFPPVPPTSEPPVLSRPRSPQLADPRRLLFVGRMDPLKGGAVLLAALPRIAKLLDAPIVLTFVGDGPARRAWEAQAAVQASRHKEVGIRFRGWLGGRDLRACYRDADVIVMPSLWPEPFGRAGFDAAAYGLPCAAFAVGGIPEWLTDGLNGTLAPADPPTADGIADAIARALEDTDRYAGLRRGALDLARRAAPAPYVRALVGALEAAGGSSAR